VIIKGIIQSLGRWTERLIDAKSRHTKQNSKDADGDRKGR